MKNIKIENSVFQSDYGVDIQEASNIYLSNVKVFSKQTEPVIDIINSDSIGVKNFDYSKDANLLMRVAGERTKAIMMKATDYGKTKQKVQAELGASDKAVFIK
ncbi:hypothetical protein [Niabella ginsengisoli]|uniref:Uncharacterized protein n=1 Tax=Niabella ginsengisoli TaxID=522298 RepID=A0ABS9SQP2_9BACT|nr:hypothetical protein [Niabella ginsengisoli]MCH5600718.1 hypothetical protein [Niabella ginsengisoli]